MLIAHDEMGQCVEDLSVAMRIVDLERANDMLNDDLAIMEAADLPMLEMYRGRNATFARQRRSLKLGRTGLERIERAKGRASAVAIMRIRIAGEDLKEAECCKLFNFRDIKCCERRSF